MFQTAKFGPSRKARRRSEARNVPLAVSSPPRHHSNDDDLFGSGYAGLGIGYWVSGIGYWALLLAIGCWQTHYGITNLPHVAGGRGLSFCSGLFAERVRPPM